MGSQRKSFRQRPGFCRPPSIATCRSGAKVLSAQTLVARQYRIGTGMIIRGNRNHVPSKQNIRRCAARSVALGHRELEFPARAEATGCLLHPDSSTRSAAFSQWSDGREPRHSPCAKLQLVGCACKRQAPVGVETLAPEATVEGLDEGVVLRLSAPAQVQGDAVDLGPEVWLTWSASPRTTIGDRLSLVGQHPGHAGTGSKGRPSEFRIRQGIERPLQRAGPFAGDGLEIGVILLDPLLVGRGKVVGAIDLEIQRQTDRQIGLQR
jgi:hypothetical protein